MTDKHLSTQFDSELAMLSSRVMALGGLAESQIRRASVNRMEVDIDRELSTVLARRQPTARDLRLLMAISRRMRCSTTSSTGSCASSSPS